MDIAVVIPVYNGEAWIEQTLQSVFNQSKLPREVVVVDDGSTDRSVEIVKRFSDVTLVRGSENSANATRNYGFRLTTAPLVAFLDQDDMWHPEHLRLMSRLLSAESSAVAALSKVQCFDANRLPHFAPPKYEPQPFDPWKDYPINTGGEPAAAVIRRDAFKAVGGWTMRFHGVGDYYMWLRLGLQGPLVRNQGETVGHRIHDESLGSSLRKEKAFTYYKRHVAASEEAFQRRIHRDDKQVDRYARRLEANKVTAAMLASILEGNMQRLNAEALSFEQCVVDEPADFIWKLWSQLGWYLEPHLVSPVVNGWSLFLCKTMEWLQHWPSEAKVSGQVLRTEAERRIAGRAALYMLAKQPWRFEYWKRLVCSVWQKMRAIVATYRPGVHFAQNY